MVRENWDVIENCVQSNQNGKSTPKILKNCLKWRRNTEEGEEQRGREGRKERKREKERERKRETKREREETRE